jgi:hypothetical protein
MIIINGPTARTSHKIRARFLILEPLHFEEENPFRGGGRLRKLMILPWIRRLAAGLSPRKNGFDPCSINVGFVLDKVAL